MTFSYDAEFDTLYVQFTDDFHKECEYLEREEGKVLRIDPESGHVVGCTILGFNQRMKREDVISLPEIQETFGLRDNQVPA